MTDMAAIQLGECPGVGKPPPPPPLRVTTRAYAPHPDGVNTVCVRDAVADSTASTPKVLDHADGDAAAGTPPPRSALAANGSPMDEDDVPNEEDDPDGGAAWSRRRRGGAPGSQSASLPSSTGFAPVCCAPSSSDSECSPAEWAVPCSGSASRSAMLFAGLCQMCGSKPPAATTARPSRDVACRECRPVEVSTRKPAGGGAAGPSG